MKYHNEKKKQIRTSRAYIDRKLHKNYNILSEIMNGKLEPTINTAWAWPVTVFITWGTGLLFLKKR